MPSTLLALAIALILALLAALIGPHFIDWSVHRARIESQASHIAGMPVRVRGPIDLRLLPTPSLTASDIQVGDSVLARELKVEFAFAPILRGEWRADQLRLVGPHATFALDDEGRITWRAPLRQFSADTVAIERLAIEDGRVTMTRQGAVATTLEKLSFAGDLKSLAGPLRGEGGFIAGGQRMSYRLAIGRADGNNARLRLTIEMVEQPMAVDLEGALQFAAVPRFEGRLAVTRFRPATASNGAPEVAWRMNASRLRASAAKAVSEEVELQFGPDERAVKLNGAAEMTLGRAPELEITLSARHGDIDRLLAPDSPAPPTLIEAMQMMAASLNDVPLRAVPARIGIAIEGLTLAGAQLQAVRADLASRPDGWDIERLELRAPGQSLVRFSGVLTEAPGGMSLRGPAQVDSSDPGGLFAWAEGRDRRAAPASPAPMAARGTIAVGPGHWSIEALNVRIDRKPITGRLAYARLAPDRPARLESDLKADDADLDALMASFRSIIGRDIRDFPAELNIALELGAARLFGVQCRSVSASLRLDDKGLVLDRLSIGDLGGARFALNGAISMPLSAPQGAFTLDVSAQRLDGLLAVLAKWSPEAARHLQSADRRLVPLQARLRIDIQRSDHAAGSTAKLGLEGRAGIVRLGLISDISGEFTSLGSFDWTFDGRIDADEGGVLGAIFGLDRFVRLDRRPAWARLVANAHRRGEMQLDARVAGGGFEALVKGKLREPGAANRSGQLDVALSADAGLPVPTKAKLRVVMQGNVLSVSDIEAAVGGAAVKGEAAVFLGRPHKVTGRLDTEMLEAAALLRAMSGAAPSAPGAWSSEPFTRPISDNVVGQIDIKASRVPIAALLVAREVRARLRLDQDEMAIEDITGTLGGGRLSGGLMLVHRPDGLTVKSQFALQDVELAVDMGHARQRLAGTITGQADVEGAGLTPATLMGALSGSASFSIQGGEITGLDSRAFELATRAADSGASIDGRRFGDLVTAAFDRGRFPLGRVEGKIVVTAGQVRLAPITAGAAEEFTATGLIDLADLRADLRATLRGIAEPPMASRPEIVTLLRGPIGKLERSIDVSPLVAWLMLRSIERQTRQLQDLEAARAREEKAIREMEQRAVEERRVREQKLIEQKALEQKAPDLRSPEHGAIEPKARGETTVQPNSSAPAFAAPALPPPIDIRPIGQPQKPTRPAAAAPQGQAIPRGTTPAAPSGSR